MNNNKKKLKTLEKDLRKYDRQAAVFWFFSLLMLIGLVLYSIVHWLGGVQEVKLWGREVLGNLGIDL